VAKAVVLALRFWLLMVLSLGCHLLTAQVADTAVTIESLQEELKLALGDSDLRRTAKAHEQIGRFNMQYPKLLSDGLRSLIRSYDCFSSLKDSTSMFRVSELMSNCYLRMRRFDMAADRLIPAADYYKRKKDSGGQAHAYALLAQIYNAKGDEKETERYQAEALIACRQSRDSSQFAELLIDLSEIQLRKKNIDSASTLVYQSLQLSRKLNEQELIQKSMNNLGQVFMAKGNYPDAVYYLQQSLNFLPTLETNPFIRRDIYQSLGEAFEKTGNLPEGMRYMKAFVGLNDSLNDIGQIELISRFSEEFGVQEKDKTIQQLNKENDFMASKNSKQRFLLYATLALFVFIFVGGGIFFQLYRQRMRNRQTILEQNEELNRRQLQVAKDRLRIESMQSMVIGQEKERARIARDIHDSLGGMLSTAKLRLNAFAYKQPGVETNKDFEQAYKLVDESCTEIRNIAHIMQPVALAKLGLEAAIRDLLNKIPEIGLPHTTFQCFGIDKQLDKTVALTAYRIVQEAVQNALKHAQATDLLIEIQQHGEQLSITVEDNGVGFDKNAMQHGMGLDNIEFRAKFIGGEVEIESKQGEGTTFMAILPTKLQGSIQT
jgi:signal transduction histidine kinase